MAGFLLPRDFCLEKLLLCFWLCLWVFFSPGEAVGGIRLSLTTLLLSLKPLFVIFPPPQIPGSQYCLKLTLLRLVLRFSYLENCVDSISSDKGDGHLAKAKPNALETKPQQLQLPTFLSGIRPAKDFKLQESFNYKDANFVTCL